MLETTSASNYPEDIITDDLLLDQERWECYSQRHQTDGFLRRNFTECTPRAKSATYTTMVHPTLDNASAVWNPHEQKDIQVEKVRRWAAGHVLNNYTDRSPGSVTAMLEKLEWVSVEEQRRNIPLEVLYKINNSIADISPTNCIHHSDSRTRGAERLCHEQIGHPVLSSSFFPHTVSDWNHLLLSIASACSLESFEAPHGCSLPNLQPVHATPWTPHEMYIVLTVQIKNFNQFFFFFLITCHWLGANGNHRMTDVTVGF